MLFDLIELLRINDTGAETNAPWEGDGDQQAWRTKDIAPPPRSRQRWLSDGGGLGWGVLPPQAGRQPSLPLSSQETWPRFNMQRCRGRHGGAARGVLYFKQSVYNRAPADAGICQNSAMGKIYLSCVEGPVTLGLRALK